MSGDYRNVSMLYYLLGITPSVVILTDWVTMGVSYIRMGICYDSPRYTSWYYVFYQHSLYRTQRDVEPVAFNINLQDCPTSSGEFVCGGRGGE